MVSSLATWQSKETRLRLLRLMNSFEVMIICLLDGCISKKIPTDFKIRGGLSASRLPACSAVDWTFKGGAKKSQYTPRISQTDRIRLERGWPSASLFSRLLDLRGGLSPKKIFRGG